MKTTRRCFATAVLAITLPAALPLAVRSSSPARGTTANAAAAGVAVSLAPAQAGRFEDALKALAAQGKVFFVAEGRPLRPTLPPNEAPKIENLPLEEAVSRLADAYDYEVMSDIGGRRQGNRFLLNKRYSDPDDLPCVTLEEYTQSVKDVLRFMTPYSPQPPVDPFPSFVSEFAKTVTPEQQQAMRNEPLPLSALTPTQQAHMWRMALHGYTGIRLRSTTDALFILEQAPGIVLRMGEFSGSSVLGYDYTGPSRRIFFRQMNGALDYGNSHRDVDPPPVSDGRKVDLKQTAWEGKPTLSSVVAALNKRSRDGGGPALTVDAALAEKPVTVVGAGVASPAQVLVALADVYGLRVLKQEGGTSSRLTRREVRAAPRIAELPRAVYRALPQPLLRVLNIRDVRTMRREQQELQKVADDATVPPERRRVAQAQLERLAAEEVRPGSSITAVVRKAAQRLRAATEPILNKGGRQARVPLSALGAAERSAFALTVLESFVKKMNSKYGQELPPVLGSFNQAYLTGGPYEEGGKRFYQLTLTVSVTNPDGSKDESFAGVGGVPFPGP